MRPDSGEFEDSRKTVFSLIVFVSKGDQGSNTHVNCQIQIYTNMYMEGKLLPLKSNLLTDEQA